MMSSRFFITWKSRRPLVALVLAGLVLAGCEEDVNPVLGTERAFTLYGFMNPRSDTQAVRIFPVEGRLALTRPEPLDAVVVSTHLQTGERHTWRDSVVAFSSGRYGHVFWALFRPDYEHRYRLEVRRSDGATSSVEVEVPPVAEPVVLSPSSSSLPVLWRNAPRLNDIEVSYVTTRGEYVFEYGIEQERVEGGQQVIVRFRDDARDVFSQIFEIYGRVVKTALCTIEMRVLVSNEEWTPPTGVYDPELLVEPGTFSNVENGFGFVGAGYPDSLRWLPPEDVMSTAGFSLDSTTVARCEQLMTAR